MSSIETNSIAKSLADAANNIPDSANTMSEKYSEMPAAIRSENSTASTSTSAAASRKKRLKNTDKASWTNIPPNADWFNSAQLQWLVKELRNISPSTTAAA